MPKKVLILGASGLLGWHCVQQLNSRGFHVIGTYNSVNPNQFDSDSNNRFIKFDSADFESEFLEVLKQWKPVAIVNTIANINLSHCEENIESAKEINTNLVKKLIETLESQGANEHFIQISTDSVYGNQKNLESKKWQEADEKKPLSVYAKTKLEAEEFVQSYSGNKTVLRTAFYGKNNFHKEKGLFNWMLNGQETEINGWANVYFSPVSAYTLAQVVSDCIESKIDGTYNVGCTDGCSKYEFIAYTCELLGNNKNVKQVVQEQNENDIRPMDTRLDSTKLKELLPNRFCDWKEDLSKYISGIES